MPIGFKNRTDGNINVAIDAIIAAGESHSFPTLTKDGAPAIMETNGNPHCFLILRGGSNGPNYDKEHIEKVSQQMLDADIQNSIIIDCSHGNSNKDYRNQSLVVDNICEQLEKSSNRLCGVMIESHINAGNQKLAALETLAYGKSITDACIDWQETEQVLGKLAAAAQSKKSNPVQDSN